MYLFILALYSIYEHLTTTNNNIFMNMSRDHSVYITLSWACHVTLLSVHFIRHWSLICLSCLKMEKKMYVSWSHHFESFTVATMTWLTVAEYMCHKWPRICSTCRKHFPIISSLRLIAEFVTRVILVAIVEQELLPEHLSSPGS